MVESSRLGWSTLPLWVPLDERHGFSWCGRPVRARGAWLLVPSSREDFQDNFQNREKSSRPPLIITKREGLAFRRSFPIWKNQRAANRAILAERTQFPRRVQAKQTQGELGFVSGTGLRTTAPNEPNLGSCGDRPPGDTRSPR